MQAYQRLLRSGVDGDSAKRWLASELVRLHMDARSDEYWRSPVERDHGQQLVLARAQAAARDAVQELLGRAAAEDRSFDSIFRPLQGKYPFLNSEKQLALQSLRLQAQARALARSKGGQVSAQQAQVEYLASVQKLLTEEEYFEYQLRSSPQAQALLASGFEFSEREFREVFKASARQPSHDLPQLALGGASPIASVESEVREALGEERFGELQRSQDPAYRLLLAVGGHRGLPAQTVEEAYAVYAHSQSETRRIQSSKALAPLAKKEAMNASILKRDTKLRQLLGEAAFLDVSRALALQLPGASPVVISRGVSVE